MDLLALLEELDERVFNAKMLPMTDQVRLDLEQVLAHVGRMRAQIPPELPPESGVRATVDGLEQLFREAQGVPLTDQVRVDKEGIYELLDGLRLAIVEELGPRRAEEQADTRPVTRISVEEAARDLKELVERARFGGETFVIEVAGMPMARIEPPPDT